MFYVTGDPHGDFRHIKQFCENHETTKEDTMIVLGDAGLNYWLDESDQDRKRVVERLPISFLCIHGNHEARPENVGTYHAELWNGGSVYVEDEFPSIRFAQDGEIYKLGNKMYIAIGGAYSVDKAFRLQNGTPWFADEQPDEEIKKWVEHQLSSVVVDGVLSHTCPLKYEPLEAFLPMVNQSTVDKSTEKWLDQIEEKIKYQKWYCGHWHITKQIDKMTFLYHTVEELWQG